MLAPEAAVIAAVTGTVALVGRHAIVWLCAAAALVAAAYVRKLVALARVSADQRVPPVTPGAAFRADLPRCLGSVAARSAGATLLGLITGLGAGTAAALGLLVGLTIGWVQLTRQVAIVLTFREAVDSHGS